MSAVSSSHVAPAEHGAWGGEIMARQRGSRRPTRARTIEKQSMRRSAHTHARTIWPLLGRRLVGPRVDAVGADLGAPLCKAPEGVHDERDGGLVRRAHLEAVLHQRLRANVDVGEVRVGEGLHLEGVRVVPAAEEVAVVAVDDDVAHGVAVGHQLLAAHVHEGGLALGPRGECLRENGRVGGRAGGGRGTRRKRKRMEEGVGGRERKTKEESSL